MLKILNKFKSDQSLKNAKSLINYIGKHPMAMVVATLEDNKVLHQARLVIWNCTTD